MFFKKLKTEHDFKDELFNELLRFHVEKSKEINLDSMNLGFSWKFYRNEGIETPYSDVIDEFRDWLIKKRKYSSELVNRFL